MKSFLAIRSRFTCNSIFHCQKKRLSSAILPVDLTVIATEGYVLKGLNVFVGEQDPVIKADSEYPKWMWEVLQEPKASELANAPLVSIEQNPELFRRQQKALRKERIRKRSDTENK